MMTVEKFLRGLEDNSRIQCVAGFRGLNRRLTSFTIVDTPEIINWVRGGEFVVDSGYITKQTPDLLKNFVSLLKEKECAALGIKLHRYFDEIPKHITEQGDLLDFPIFILPYDLPFCDFSYSIYKSLFDDLYSSNNTPPIGTFFSDVLSSKEVTAEQLEFLCRSYGFDYVSTRICLTVKTDSWIYLSAAQKKAATQVFSDLVSYTHDTRGLKTYSLHHGNDQIIYLLFSKQSETQLPERTAREMAKKAYRLLSDIHIVAHIGISPPHKSILHIASAYRESLDAIFYGSYIHPDKGIYEFNRYFVYRWLHAGMNRKELMSLYEQTAAPLINARADSLDLVHVLETFIESRYNVSKTAVLLHAHRNTVMHYLEKINALLPLDMTQPENMLTIQLGIHAMRLLDLKQPGEDRK